MMRKIVAGLFISLDGVVESPDKWHFPYFSEEMGAAIGGQMAASDTMLLGRQTYQEFASYWPTQGVEADKGIADHMNNTPKLVVSSTLDNLEWNNSTLIPGDRAVEELTARKQQPGKDISVVGSPTLVRTLLRDRVLDELDLLVHPIVVGSGKRLFPDGSEQQGLALVSSETFKTGVLRLVYRPA
jgi:dihydrofolate reductase